MNINDEKASHHQAKVQLILGGARSGKSSLAEQYAAALNMPVTYLATGQAFDAEMEQRIKQHQQQRPVHWQLIESPLLLAKTLASELLKAQEKQEKSVLLVDCLTLWLSNCLCYSGDEQNTDNEEIDLNYWQQEKQQLLALLNDIQQQEYLHIILVSNEVGHGIVPMGELSRQFVDQAGWLHQAIAKVADNVEFVMAGLPLTLKSAGTR